MFFFDPMYFLFMIPPLIFMFYAQAKVNSTFKKYSQVASSSRITGVEAAQRLLKANGLNNVRVENVKGKLSDHYDPSKKVLRLSPDVSNSYSVAALGVVAHEVGHAMQDKEGYAFMKFRSALVPAANIGSKLGYIFVILGLILYALIQFDFGLTVAYIGVFLFSLAVIFSLVTLPVEFNASKRARAMLQSSGLLSTTEAGGASAVLSAAALTYVAATLQALAQLFYFIFMLMGARRR
ncbi:MAG TPA: zinc metallopeptidase [Dehalococcoidia bacterium]|nr:zinc metallopeptidase [Dehalococcoidia bacterium]